MQCLWRFGGASRRLHSCYITEIWCYPSSRQLVKMLVPKMGPICGHGRTQNPNGKQNENRKESCHTFTIRLNHHSKFYLHQKGWISRLKSVSLNGRAWNQGILLWIESLRPHTLQNLPTYHFDFLVSKCIMILKRVFTNCPWFANLHPGPWWKEPVLLASFTSPHIGD